MLFRHLFIVFQLKGELTCHFFHLFCTQAKLLIDVLPASDKSFSKLLCDAPCLPESLFRFLEGLCMSQGNNQQTKDSEGDRVTQGLGTVWSLILGRPPLRQACLDIVLKVCNVPFSTGMTGIYKFAISLRLLLLFVACILVSSSLNYLTINSVITPCILRSNIQYFIILITILG